ncbi:MAG: polysaccharide deacetylase family protein [Bacillota bacterium]|nr:polysaccharide deacetylase family protein [Bacillota bacterium]
MNHAAKPAGATRRVVIAAILCLSLLLGACQSGGKTTQTESETSPPTTTVAPTTTAPTTTAAPTTTPEPTTEETTTEPPAQGVIGTAAADLKEEDFAEYDNRMHSWWYDRVPAEQLGSGYRPGIIDVTVISDRFNGIWQHPDPEEKVIFVTMDCGYEYQNNTTQILDIAKEIDLPIAFFITKAFIDAARPALDRMPLEGHTVCNHSLMHKNGVKALEEEGLLAMASDIEDLANYYEETTGLKINPYMRPPEGAFSERTLAIYHAMGYRAVFWDMAHVDWKVDDQPDRDAALRQLVGELHNGTVILLHTCSTTNVSLLSEFVSTARAAGYRFASITEFPDVEPAAD